MLDQVIVPNIISFHSSQKQRRAAQRKERRKRKRQALAQARECGIKKAVIFVMLLNGRKCCNLCHYHNIYSVTGSNNGETYNLEDEEINDEDDEGDNTAELER